MILDSGELLYICFDCNSSFLSEASLKRHMLTHGVDRPFKCPTCARGFRQKAHLTQHLWLHRSDRPYYCDVCEKGFTSRSHLRAHMRKHIGKEILHHCDQCNSSFKELHNLQNHIYNDHPTNIAYNSEMEALQNYYGSMQQYPPENGLEPAVSISEEFDNFNGYSENIPKDKITIECVPEIVICD